MPQVKPKPEQPRKPSGAASAALDKKADAVISRMNQPKPVR